LRADDPVATAAVQEWHTDIGPDEITLYRHASYVELLSTSQINSLLQHPQSFGTLPLLRVKYSRFVQPIANIVLLLLAIPCVLTREPGSIKLAATRTVLLTGACMGSLFLAHQLAGRSPSENLTSIWPALAMAIPIFVFAPIAVWQLERVKT
jgi:lipopolysaccharide export LptBFGC system permease protein LptF